MESGRQRSPCKGSPVRVSKACSPVVVFPTQFRKGFADSSTQTTPHGVFGCLNRGLGWSYPGSRGVRVVDEISNTVPHQFFGNDGGSQCLNTLEGHIYEQCSLSGHRQFHSGGISEQARGHSFQKLVPLGKTPIAWAAKYNIKVRARYIPGQLNAIADGLSRKNQIVATEWSLYFVHKFSRSSPIRWEGLGYICLPPDTTTR